MQSPDKSKQLPSSLDFYTMMSGENVTQLFAQISVPRNFRSSTNILFGWAKMTWKENDWNKKSRLDLTVVTFSNDLFYVNLESDFLDRTNLQFQKGFLLFILKPYQFSNYPKLLELELRLTPAFRKKNMEEMLRIQAQTPLDGTGVCMCIHFPIKMWPFSSPFS